MQITYDPDRDILQIAFNTSEVGETAQISPNLILDYDDDGLLVGLEPTVGDLYRGRRRPRKAPALDPLPTPYLKS